MLNLVNNQAPLPPLEDVEMGRQSGGNGVQGTQVNRHQGQQEPDQITQPGFLLPIVAAILFGGTVLITFLGLILFFKGWTNLIERAMTWTNEDRDFGSNRKRAARLVFCGFLIALELLVLVTMLKAFVPWAYSRILMAWKLEDSDELAYVLHGLIWLTAGLLFFNALQGCLVAQEVIIDNGYDVSWSAFFLGEIEDEGYDDELDVGADVPLDSDDDFNYDSDYEYESESDNNDNDFEFDLDSDEGSSNNDEEDGMEEENIFCDDDAEPLV